MANVPEWQTQIYEEVLRVAGSQPIAAEHIEHLANTEQVLNEAIRLYSPASILSRRSVEVTVLGNLKVEFNAVIMILIFVVHRHKLNWDNPNAFNPARFDPDKDRTRLRHAFMPFGAGRRSCIGALFALLEAKVILATLNRRVRFECIDRTKPVPHLRVALRPRGGIALNIIFR